MTLFCSMLDGMLKSGDEPWGPLPSGVKVAGRFAEKNVLASFHPAVSGQTPVIAHTKRFELQRRSEAQESLLVLQLHFVAFLHCYKC